MKTGYALLSDHPAKTTDIMFVVILQIIVVGDEDGNVNIYQLKKMNATPEDQVRHNYQWGASKGLQIKDTIPY